MVRYTQKENIDYFKDMVKDHEPYPMEIYYEMASCFDDPSHEDDVRFISSMCLDVLMQLGFTEDEVNPWKNKR